MTWALEPHLASRFHPSKSASLYSKKRSQPWTRICSRKAKVKHRISFLSLKFTVLSFGISRKGFKKAGKASDIALIFNFCNTFLRQFQAFFDHRIQSIYAPANKIKLSVIKESTFITIPRIRNSQNFSCSLKERTPRISPITINTEASNAAVAYRTDGSPLCKYEK